ncbi:tRNA-(ms[2]io[6]A)-hydroxylase [Aquimarina litoralis]|uniref:tRNA-(Ms[2]io[6]A)-hydroxylase n=2 Tax=Aquimarina litoralis TaxID=584605 RepID=A0ABN1IVZ2_9FLAO
MNNIQAFNYFSILKQYLGPLEKIIQLNRNNMLGLKLPTDPRWVNIVEKNIEEILTDHAYCEQKATSTAISLIVSFPEYTELVQEMTKLVKEEISHFKMVHDKIIARGWTLGRDRKDDYVIQLVTFFPKGGSRTTQLVHRLLYAALIEARSCERFKLLSEELEDQELAKFYRDLMVSEANHYTMFLNFARQYGDRKEVDQKWQDLLEFEAEIMQSLSKKETIHG